MVKNNKPGHYQLKPEPKRVRVYRNYILSLLLQELSMFPIYIWEIMPLSSPELEAVPGAHFLMQ